MSDTLIDFLRHGQPEGGRRYRGYGVDDPLTEKGWQQMWNAVGDKPQWDQIISSPMTRCRAFAGALGKEHHIPVAIEDSFKEVGFGTWEGMSRDELVTQHRAEFDAFYQDPVHHRPAGAEPLEAFGQRVARAMDRTLANHPGKHILVIAHAGVIRATLGHVMQCPPAAWYRAQVSNGCMTRYRLESHGLVLEFHNRPSL